MQHLLKAYNKLILLAAITVLGLVMLVHAQIAHAASKPIDVYVNDEQITFTIDPDIKAGTTVVQMRPLFEALGMDVTWNGTQRTVAAEKTGIKLLLTIDSDVAVVNGRSVKLDRPAVEIKGHTLVPLRFVSESTESIVHWNGVHREIIVYTPEYVTSHGYTMEEVREMLLEAQKQVNAAYEAQKEAEKAKPSIVLPPVVKQPTGPVKLNELQGMYYGGKYDYGGYQCGGVCWMFYTFLPDQKVVVGHPANGGPETVNCNRDTCHSYSIKDGKLLISGQDTLSISVNKDGILEIDEVAMRKVVPVPDGTKLGGKYISQGYTGLVGITPFSTSWTNEMIFYPNGTFTSDTLSLASLNTGDARTDSAASGKTVKGTYKISSNTIELTYEDGTVERHVFAIPPQQNDDRVYVQIGEQSFHMELE